LAVLLLLFRRYSERKALLISALSFYFLFRVVSGCTNLRRLNLIGLDQLTNRTLEAVAQNLEFVSELEMKECRLINDEGLAHLARGRNISLHTFNFEFCYKISDRGISSLCDLALKRNADRQAPIEVLNLGHLACLTGHALLLIAQCAGRYLRSLNVAGCTTIDSTSVIEVLQACPRLKVINLSGLPCLTDGLLEDILEHNWYNLEKLHISCGTFTEALLNEFKCRKPSPVILHINNESPTTFQTMPPPTEKHGVV